MNAFCKISNDLSQPNERFLVQNLKQVPITLKSNRLGSETGKLFFADGPLEAIKLPTAEGVEPWLVFPGKARLGLPWGNWLERFWNDEVEIRRITPDGSEAIDEKKSST